MIYIVEDDLNIRELESYALKSSGFEVLAFERASAFFGAMQNALPDVILLDIMLPEEDGLSILKKIRSSDVYRGIPVLMVTAKTTELDAVKALDLGADDYIAKPFGVLELVSRVKAVMRRTKSTNKTTFSTGKITVDDEKHIVFSDGVPVDLTFKEYELLKYLLMNANLVLSREKIMNTIWGYDFDAENRTVDVHIQTLRKKLGEQGGQIKTVRNVGYRLTE